MDIHTHHPHPDVLSPTMAGIHPWHAERGETLPDFAACDIIGETGLDYACGVDKAIQERLFRAHLVAAERLHKPVVLHTVRAFEPTIKILADYGIKYVVFHGFTGSEQQAKEAIKSLQARNSDEEQYAVRQGAVTQHKSAKNKRVCISANPTFECNNTRFYHFI